MQQKRLMPDRREKRWEVDTAVIKKLFPNYKWLNRDRLLERDLKEMGDYLPHWILTVGNYAELLRSDCCKDNLIPSQGELRCVICDGISKAKPSSLHWFGLIPVNLEGRDKAIEKLQTARAKSKLSSPIITPNGKRHLMVPMLVEYHANWPTSPPLAHYANSEYIQALGLSSGGNHIVSTRSMCLYHNAHWNDNNGIMHVISNRMAPHAFALLKLGNGEKNVAYFETNYGNYDDYR